MIATLGYCLRDEEITLELARWIKDLGGCPAHDLFLIHDRRCNKNLVQAILDAFIPSFKAVYPGEAPAEIDGWPQGANYFLRIMSCMLQSKPYGEFLWLEPDAIPLVPGWMDAIEREYRGCGRPFMGDRVDVENIDLHMSGIGVYPNPLYALAGEAYRATDVAFDMAGKDQIVPKAHFTKFIEHAWKHPEFTMMSELETQIRKEAVLFHASKDGSLIRLLRQKLFPAVPVLAEAKDSGRVEVEGEAKGESLERGGTQNDGVKRNDVPRGSRETSLSGSVENDARTNSNRLITGEDFGEHEIRQPKSGSSAPPAQTSMGGGGERLTEKPGESISSLQGRHDPPQPASPTCDIFIRTYHGDIHWLVYCLKAIKKFASGFRKVWVVSPEADAFGLFANDPLVEWKQMNDESEDGYLAQQISKLYADVITDYAADYILHIDSDVILTRSVTPGDFFTQPLGSLDISQQKVVWPYTTYKSIETPWQPITEKFMNDDVENEFMRRFPIMVPQWLYPRLREFAFKLHRMPIADYIRNQPHRAFSEFNALGAYAWKFHHNRIAWVNTQGWVGWNNPPVYARQFHSYSGITPEVKAEIETILSGTAGTPSVKAPISRSAALPAQKPFDGTESKPAAHSHTQGLASRTSSVPSQIKVLPNGLWVLKGDQISQWIEQEGRLDHDQNLLPKILEHIKPGDVVFDVGAFIGDHTVAYARAVGDTGIVYAFEPNPIAFECLEHNTSGMRNVVRYQIGLGDRSDIVPLSGNNGNAGGAYIGEHMKVAYVDVSPLDDELPLQADLIKIDVEGYELKVLRGAEKTITTYHPKMVIEINEEALRRQGTTPADILEWLDSHDYTFSILQENCDGFSPLYDILAEPLEVKKDKEVRDEVTEKEPGSPPEAPSDRGVYLIQEGSDIEERLETSLSIMDHVKELETYARQGIEQMKYVRKLLKKRGIMPMARKR